MFFKTGQHSRIIGGPRNNPIFFQLEPKRIETQSVSVVFQFVSRNQTNFVGLFQFVSVFQTGIETTETNRKNLQKTNLY